MNSSTQAQPKQNQIKQPLPNDAEPAPSIDLRDVRFYSVIGKDKHGNCRFISPLFATLRQAKAFSAYSKQQYPCVRIQEETSYFQSGDEDEAERQELLAAIIPDDSIRPPVNAELAKHQVQKNPEL